MHLSYVVRHMSAIRANFTNVIDLVIFAYKLRV